MMKKYTLHLLIVLVLCLALTGCGLFAKRVKAPAVNTANSSDNTTSQDTGNSTGKDTGSNTGKNTGKDTGSSTGKNTGKDIDSSTGKNTGKNTGKDIDSSTGKNTGKNTGSNTGKNASNSSGINTDKKPTKTPEKIQNTGSSSDSDSGNDSGSSSGSGSGSGSGSSSGGGSTAPAVQGKKVIESVAEMNDITVDYGTDKAAAAAKLPGTVVLICRDGSTVRGSVTSWVVDASYSATPDTQTTYKATGVVTIPAEWRVFSGTTLKATVGIIVRGGDTVVKKVIEPGGIEVKYNTSEAEAMKRLPSGVKVECVSGDSTFATVTWNRKSGTYIAAPIVTSAITTYTGTVKLPDGYRLDSSTSVKTTIETTITVLKEGKNPKLKNVTSIDTPEISIPYMGRPINTDEIKKYLPDKVRLHCEDDSVISVAVKKEQWSDLTSDTSDMEDYAGKHSSDYPYKEITLPDGYQFGQAVDKENAKVTAVICEKKRDNTKLKKARSDAIRLYERIKSIEKTAYNNDGVYLAPKGTTPSDITAGVKFIVDNGEKDEFYEVFLIEYHDLSRYEPDKDQAFVDKKAEEINVSMAALRNILDNKYQIGTCFTDVNIAKNVTAMLESESFKRGGSYAYDPANQPMILGKEYLLPQYVTVVVDAKGTTAEVELEWDVRTSSSYTITKCDEEGNKLKNAVLKPTAAHKDEPNDIVCEVQAVGYWNGNNRVDLNNMKVEIYNNCIVGAPIRQDTSWYSESDIPVLISGTENSFTVKAAFPYYSYYKIIEKIEPGQITVKMENIWTGDDGKPLLSDIKLTGVNTAQDANPFVPEFTMTATTAKFFATVNQNASLPFDKMKISIPADAITLTEKAVEENWYIPEDGLELEAEVRVRRPEIIVESVEEQFPNKNWVDVSFRTKYWNGSSDVQVALVKSSFHETNFPPLWDTQVLSISDTISVDSDKSYMAEIYTKYLSKDTWYNVWFKVGDDSWRRTMTEYKVPSSNSATAMLAGLAGSQALKAPEDGMEPEAEENPPAVTVERAQLSEDKSRVTVAFRTKYWNSSSVQTALVPGTEDTFDGTAAGSFVSVDAVTVEADGEYSADISVSGITAGDYTVWVKAGDEEWQKSTMTYTHSDAASDTHTDTDSDAAADPIESRDAITPENNLPLETKENDSAEPDENAQSDIPSNSAGSDESGE